MHRLRYRLAPIAVALLAVSSSALAKAPAYAQPEIGSSSLVMAPTSDALQAGQTQQFIVAEGSTLNPAVTWEVNGVAGGSASTGTISSSGLYTAPASIASSTKVTVTAVLQSNSAAAIVTLQPPQLAVQLSPASVAVAPGGSTQFKATVANAANTSVTWEVNGIIGGNTTVGTISSSGSYIAPATAPQPSVVIVSAISQYNPAAAANAPVTIGSGATYYVATSGNDNNNGSAAAPWRTLQHAANTAVAGNTVYVAGGVYNETVNFPHSGNASAGYINFESQPGQTAIVDGTGLAITGGQYGLFTIDNQNYISLTGFELRNYLTTSKASVPVGIYVYGADSNIQILGNHIHDITTLGGTCKANALGMAIYGSAAPAPIQNLVISGNQVDHLATGCSESVTLNGNVTNWTVSNNIIHDNNNIGLDAIGFEKVSPQTAYDQARNGEIVGNIVYDITSYDNSAYGKQYAADGIYVDGGTQIVIERNVVHHADLNMEFASEHGGHYTSYVTARSNLVYAGNAVGISIGGYAASKGGTQNCSIVNNTLLENDTENTGSGEFQIQYNASSNLFENNIVYASAQGIFLNDYTKSTTTPAQIDYNLYNSSVGATKGEWIWKGKTYTGLSAWKAGSSEDAHALFADPLLGSLSIPDLVPGAGSPAYNAGIDAGAAVVGTQDFAGTPRTVGTTIDIGAYEH